MFTGLIEGIGTVAEVTPAAAGFRIRVQTALNTELSPGDSFAVNGVCLTVAASDPGSVAMDVSPQTARVTTMGSLQPGSLVNLERSLSVGARLGGHFVQGHVDATGRLEEVVAQGDAWWLTVTYPHHLAPYIVSRGSIAVDGISLTVADLDESTFSVQIVPFTWQHTNLQASVKGTRVNLESDILGKYVVRALAVRGVGAVPQAVWVNGRLDGEAAGE